MDPAQFRESVEAAKRTQLDRLASNKLLLSLTDAELEEGPVLAAAAHSEFAARNTFRAWADDEDDEAAREAFAATAEREQAHYDRVLAAMDDPEGFDPVDGGPMHAYLRGREGTVERVAAGMVGRSMVSVRAHTQVIGFFVNEADTARADLFRDLKADTRDTLETGLDLLGDRCSDDEDWDAARGPAEYVIQVAYDDYADSLSGMGLDPKPIC